MMAPLIKVQTRRCDATPRQSTKTPNVELSQRLCSTPPHTILADLAHFSGSVYSAKHRTEKAHWKEKEVDLGKQWNARDSLYEPRLTASRAGYCYGFPDSTLEAVIPDSSLFPCFLTLEEGRAEVTEGRTCRMPLGPRDLLTRLPLVPLSWSPRKQIQEWPRSRVGAVDRTSELTPPGLGVAADMPG